MIIFPAVDIQGGRAVRLKKGRKEDVTIFADNPIEAARHWQQKGAQWLHIVDLDGAFEGKCANAALIGAITSEVGIPIQVGGGIRTIEDAKRYLDAGVTRLIIGTVALEKPQILKKMCNLFPDKIGVSLDGDDGILKTQGWVKDSGKKIEDVIPELENAGVSFIIYTDIERDGMHSGVNIDALKRLLNITKLPVIAAGGVSTLADIKNIYNLRNAGNLEGVISGRALYDGSLQLEEALACSK